MYVPGKEGPCAHKGLALAVVQLGQHKWAVVKLCWLGGRWSDVQQNKQTNGKYVWCSWS